ncbi:unnamed protein product [Rhodiola kirilowii]
MAESGTCNVCSAPCTSCMHFNRSVTGIKTETSSGQAICDNTSSQHSANKTFMLKPIKKQSLDNLQDTASATSSHESISENFENKETVGTNCVSKRGQIPGRDQIPSKSESPGLDCAQSKKGIPITSNSDVSLKPRMKTELGTEKDGKYLPEESLDVVNASSERSNDPAELLNVKEPLLESHSGDESEEIVEHDVNICDICGDAGREDLLATCSGCSDGAEHTYCMQEKMDKVPDGEWFCEECRLAEKVRKQHDMVDEAVKIQPYSRLRSINRNLSLKLDSKEPYADGNRKDVYNRKRHLEKVDSSIASKRQATEIAKDLSIASSPHRLSRDGSFKSIAREKVNKSVCQPSQGIHNLGTRPQTHRGSLSKSNSFNAVSLKSKGKSMDDMTHNQKVLREPSDARDGPSRLIGRSLSLRPAHLGRPNTSEPKVKMLSPKSSHAPEMKGFKKSKEHLSYDRRKAFRDERTLSMSSSHSSVLDTDQKIGSCENGLVPDHNSRDSKATQSDGKVTPLNKLVGHATRNSSDMPEKKLNKPNGKDESASGTWTAAKHSSNIDAILNPELLPSQDASYEVVKNTDNNLTRSRHGKLVPGNNLCQRCKEPNTAAHVCMISSSRMSAADPSAVGTLVDDVDKINSLKAALHAAFLKKPAIYKKRRSPDHEQFDEQPVIPNSNGRHVPQDLSSVSNYTKNNTPAEKKHVQKSPLHSFSYVSGQESSIHNFNQSSLPSKEYFSSKEMMSGSVVSADGKSITKALPSTSIALTSAIPVHEHIWLGDFEVNRNGEKVADMHSGFQAHLSTFASPNVMEVIYKLSPKLSLAEIPRVSAWPAQFHETGPTEDNIALYFFAKDIESYEKHYKTLLDHMMRDDLALKGTVNGVEILIFPSSQLPQKSQRWNMLFFLWGVFRAKKHNCQSQMGSISKLDTTEKPCMASDASRYLPVPAHPVQLTDSKQLDCVSVRHSMSGCSSSCAQSRAKGSSANSFGEERIVGVDRGVEPKPRLNGGTPVTDSAEMLGNKCTPVLEGSANGSQGTLHDRQELYSVGSEGIHYFMNDKRQVGGITIERKIMNEDSDVKPNPKKDPSINDHSAKGYDCEESNYKKSHLVDLTEVSCPNSDRDNSGTLLAIVGPDSKDVAICCSNSGTHEAGPSISSKKIMYDLNLDARDLLDESGTAEGFQSVVEYPRVVDFQGANSNGWDLNSSANDVQVDGDSKDRQHPVLPSFDLALCADTESFPPRNDALPLFVETAEPFEGGVGRKEDAPAASLSLSLALPFMDEKQQSIRQATTSAEQLPTQGKPPFLLFGALADK